LSEYRLTYNDDSVEVIIADRLYEVGDELDFVTFTHGQQERYATRDRRLIRQVERDVDTV
jgi:hypothetical protein